MSVATAVNPGSKSSAASRERVELILSHLDRLPALPSVVARLLAVTTSEESSARDVVTVIESDASLTAGLLRMVRRADLGVHDRAMTVSRAVTLLGFRAVRNAALSSRFFETLSTDASNPEADRVRRALWEHSLAVACAAEMIAEQIEGGELSGEAFVCGLLHDVGKIALDVCLPKSYTRAAEHAEQHGKCICDVEREIFGLDHTQSGKRLASRWQLPSSIVECIWLHHQNPDDMPTSVAHPRHVRIVHLADNLARRQRIGFSGYQHVADVNSIAASLGIPEKAVESVSERLHDRMEPFRVLLGLGDGAEMADSPEAQSALNRRLSEINAQLSESNRCLSFRSACFEAIECFTAAANEQDRVADVCAAAAEAAAGLFDAKRSAVFARRGDSRCIHVGWFDGSTRRRHSTVIDPGSTMGSGDSSSIVRDENATTADSYFTSAPSGNGITPATDDLGALWRQATNSTSPLPLWVLPIRLENGVGGVLVETEEQQIASGRSLPGECGAVGRAFGLAISSAAMRVDAENMTEELLDLNRRCRSAEKQLVRMRSIAMVAEMAAGAAHELNNPLAVISGRAQMELGFALDPERRRAMEIIISQTQKASQIVLDLMSFAKPEPPQPVLQGLKSVLDQLAQHWRTTSDAAAQRLNIEACDAVLTVFADAQQLREILIAVAANAIGSCDGSNGRVQVNSTAGASDETVRIVVEDNGGGMAPDVLEHAFDPFYSNRPAGRGRGLGLSRAYRLAEINGGRLWIESTLNVGTTVTLELPSRAPTT